MTSGCRGTPYFRRYDRELVLKPPISSKKSWGATVERLQRGRQWAGLLVETVVEFGMEQSSPNPCVFRMLVDGNVELIMAVHADDIVIAGSNEACKDFHVALNTKFPTNNLGELTWCAGFAFKRNWKLGTLEITQKAFVES